MAGGFGTYADREFLIRVKADIKDAVEQMKKMAGETNKTANATDKAKPKVDGLGKSFDQLKRAVLAYLTIQEAIRILHIADAYNVLQQRIKTATKNTGDYAKVSGALYQISQKNGVALNDTVSLFQNLARTAPELGATNDQMLILTNLVQQLGVIGGSTNEQLANGLLQFSQSMASGVVHAEEFNSIIENIPELANRIAKGMGKTVGEVRNLVINGQVASQQVFDALLKQAGEIAHEFDKIPESMKRAEQALGGSTTRLLSLLDQRAGVTTTVIKVLQGVSDAINTQADAIDTNSLDAQTRHLERLQSTLKNLQDEQDSFLNKHIGGIFALGNQAAIADTKKQIQEVSDHIAELKKNIEAVNKSPLQVTPKKNPDQKDIDTIIDKLRTVRDTMSLTKEEAVLFQLQLLHASDAEVKLAQSITDAIYAHQKQQEIMDEGRRIFESTRTDMENLATELDHLDQLYTKGAFGPIGSAQALDTYSRAVFNANDKTKDLADSGEKDFARLEAAVKGWGDEVTNTLAEMVVSGKANFKDLADSIIRDLLRIMIYQTITRPVLDAIGFGSTGSAGTHHTGGIAGSASTYRKVQPALFLGAPRYHTGGFAGLSANEVPAILKKGEEVLTTNDPRHAANLGGGGNVRVEVTNKGTPVAAQSASARFDGGEMVVSVVLDDLDRNGKLAGALDKRYPRR